jgi:PAS domain S-box-containing protein
MNPSGEEPFWFETFEQQLANLPAGAHLCQFYQSPAERLQAVIPFCREGIRRRQQCVCFVPDSGVQDLLRSLRTSGMRQTRTALERRQLVPITTRDPYFVDGHFSPEAMLDYLGTLAAQAKRDNYAGLRVAGQMDWVLQPEVDTASFLSFEGRLLDEFVTTTGSRVLCQFDRPRFRAEIIHGVLRTHPQVVIGNHVVQNPYFEPGTLVAKRDAVTEERRVEWMLSQLQDKTRRDMATADLEMWALSGASPSDLMRAATHLIALELKADLAESFDLQVTDNRLHLVADVGWHIPPLDGTQIWGNPTELFADRLQPGRPLIVPDWSTEGRFKRPTVFGAEGISSSAVVAISTQRDEHLYGLLGVHFKRPRTFSVDDIAYMEKIAAALAYATTRARSEEQFRTLVEHIPDVIGRFDANLRLIYANPALEALAEAPADSLKGKTMRDVGLPDSLAGLWELVLRRAWRAARKETINFTLETRDGERYFQGAIVPERSPHGGVQSLMLIARDLTEQQRAESERARLYEDVLLQQTRLQELVARLVDDHRHALSHVGHVVQAEQLTARERQILPLLAAGWSNREIASQLGVKTGTVKNHVAKILEKLDVSDRTQAAVRAVELGLARSTHPQ